MRSLFLMLMLIVFTVPIQAQGETPTPTPRPDVPEFIYDWQDVVLYPSGIYFKLVVDRPLVQIQDLTLTLSIEGEAEPRIIPFDVLRNSIIFDRDFTELRYIWYPSADNPPPFQSIIRYNWTVITVQQETANIPGVLAFVDPNITWVQDQGSWLNLYLPEGVINTDQLREGLDPIYELLQANTGRTPRYNFFITNDSYPVNPCVTRAQIPYMDGVETCQDAIISPMIRNTGYTLFNVGQFREATIANDITHYIVGDFYTTANLPAWFLTGLIYFYTPSDKAGMVDTVKNAARASQLYTLNTLQTPDPNNPTLWDAQSYSMVVYIARLAGVEAVFELARGGEGTFAARYEAITGLPLDGLLPSWENYIFRQSALDDARLSLYAGATELPTATNTITPFPPTPTNLPTSTATSTITPTVTGVLTATPLPTRIPSATPRPGTPTITPLPAGYVFPTYTLEPSPTPIPSVATTQDNSTNIVIGIAIGLIGLAIAVVAYIRFIRDI